MYQKFQTDRNNFNICVDLALAIIRFMVRYLQQQKRPKINSIFILTAWHDDGYTVSRKQHPLSQTSGQGHIKGALPCFMHYM